MFHHIFNFLQLRLLTTKNVKLLLGEFNWQAQDYQANIFLLSRQITYFINNVK